MAAPGDRLRAAQIDVERVKPAALAVPGRLQQRGRVVGAELERGRGGDQTAGSSRRAGRLVPGIPSGWEGARQF